MSFTAFSTALSSLSADAVAIDVIGNNLANLNTPGFKASAVAFSDLVAQSLGGVGSQNQVGLGTGLPTTIRQFSQGAIQTSGGSMDAAIQGGGFFMVRAQNSEILYTRAGNFHVDALGNLLTVGGEHVQGWTMANGTINTNVATSDIVVPVGALRQPSATTQMSLDLNLDAGAATGQPSGTFSTPIEVVDSLGVSHVLTVTFTKTAANTWSYAVSIPGSDVTGGTAGSPFPIAGASGSATFDTSGKLKTPAFASGTVPIKVTGLTNGAADLNITWNLYNTDQTGRLTQYATPSSVAANSQDGTAAAQITQINLENAGKIVAHYSNGQQQILAQLALAEIRNPESLVGVGNNNLEATTDTAAPAVGAPETGGRGKIVGGALENSTVDIAREFTNLIVMQRSYQASAKVVTATDQLSQDTINMKQ